MERVKPKTIILYHAECSDGFGAAWAAWKKLGDEAIYIPVFHRSRPPTIVNGNNVITLDYCYPREILEEAIPRAASWTVVDHHIGTEAMLPLFSDALFDVNHSGAVLAWRFFHADAPVPRLLLHVEDGDLWRFALPETKAFHEVWRLRDFEFSVWDAMARDLEDGAKRTQYVREGELLLSALERDVEILVKNAETVRFEGIECLMVNSPTRVSEVGARLVALHPPLGIIWSRRKDRVIVSLRSDGSVDCNDLAKRYGGGGHPRAAAFSWDAKEFLTFTKGVLV